MSPLLDIRDLNIGFKTSEDVPVEPVVKGVNLTLERGKVLGIVGESGSGKTLSALSLMGLLPPGARVLSGEARFNGVDVLQQSEEIMREFRGRRISMLFQNPLSSFNPLHRIGRQIGEALSVHRKWDTERIRERVEELLRMVRLEDTDRIMRSFPHQLSGGQRQRAMLAMSLSNAPDLLIADEPTTALDAAVQQQVLDLLLSLRESLSLTLIVISHDLHMIHRLADDICVMQAGEIVEHGCAATIFAHPEHPYTRALLDQGGTERPHPMPSDAQVVLSAKDLKVRYPLGSTWLGKPKKQLDAVNAVSLAVRQGESLGIVGESGSGKSSLGLAVTRLIKSDGAIHYLGRDFSRVKGKELRQMRRGLQIMFQDPLSSLNPRLSVRDCVAEGLKLNPSITKEAVERRVAEVLAEVGLDPEMRHRYPHEFSGGQCQRICLARAIVMRPDCMIFDEPTSSLDRNTQFQVVRLLRELQQRHGMASLFITHDLALVRMLCHRVLIMQNGHIVEEGMTEAVFASPRHEYTRQLLEAAMLGEFGKASQKRIEGEVQCA